MKIQEFLEFSENDIDPMVKYVIVGTDTHLSFKKICTASQYINKNGAKLLGTNIDRTDGKGR